MPSLSGVFTFFISVWIIRARTQPALESIDVVTTDCRIRGIALFTGKPPFDFSEAQAVCKQLGLILASKTQVENALKHGFETCSFGWIAEGFTVISRKTSNNKCGQGKTGVAEWKVPHNRKSNAYCYNSSGIPIALLVLALIFFGATVSLAVCYIKKYKKTFPFSRKKEKRDEIETKDIKGIKPSSKTLEQEPKKNGKKAEELQAKPEPPVKSKRNIWRHYLQKKSGARFYGRFSQCTIQ
ncbi:lymphatic vessel endothelial hyaluronic acid receptor 1 isoform X2 [Sphaerodactylus townsendi]|uniref:lymphatic vessel endothelial hyaluronic acid receptor 1 isoform X2 n=1 Tax=Sphaerodactylus townsendi TaxID=933632 RepID=UPI002026EA9A|nr:lymphatic vessel endothelial hyaluronic acid receptor 1 isoform X2 [Sphaerodactylus townsendi]